MKQAPNKNLDTYAESRVGASFSAGQVRCYAKPRKGNAMEKCEFHKVETKVIPDQRIRNDRSGRPRDILEMPWCAHPKYSPVPLEDAVGFLGGGTLLKCDGDREKCKLSVDQFIDI